MFTTNIVKATPSVRYGTAQRFFLRAIVVNSGNANACTGERLEDAMVAKCPPTRLSN